MVHSPNVTPLCYNSRARPDYQRLNQTKMKLTTHFTLEELTATSFPHLQKSPSIEEMLNLMYLCAVILQPLRDEYGKPVVISSGYRSVALNNYVGGVSNSWHLRGLAADIKLNSDIHAHQLFKILERNKYVDTCLCERKNKTKWLHVQTTRTATPRRKFNYNYIP